MAVQALVAKFGLWEREWAYAEQLLLDDPRNNSAWAQRAFLLQHRLAGYVHAPVQALSLIHI